jgi:hypothetical protein
MVPGTIWVGTWMGTWMAKITDRLTLDKVSGLFVFISNYDRVFSVLPHFAKGYPLWRPLFCAVGIAEHTVRQGNGV